MLTILLAVLLLAFILSFFGVNRRNPVDTFQIGQAEDHCHSIVMQEITAYLEGEKVGQEMTRAGCFEGSGTKVSPRKSD